MKISLQWLADFLPGSLDAETAADALTHGGLPVENIERVGTDTILDVEITSNRGDCLSHVGIARELAALLNCPITLNPHSVPEAGPSIDSAALVAISASNLCPHYTARLLRGVRVGPSPPWLVGRLEAIGVRTINNVVDVTNYALFELGQPLHAFDFDKLSGGRIVVRMADGAESLTTLDGHERKLDSSMLVIADARHAVALAGVMGGRDSEVSAATRNILLESARFDPLSVRKTSRTLGLRSDSSYRFERGIDPLLPTRASVRAAQLMLEVAGGELLAGTAEAGSDGYQPGVLFLRFSKLRQVLGIDVPAQQVVDALSRLQLQPVVNGDRIEVTAPSYRLDLNIEVDLIEEVARVIGYAAVPLRDEISIRLSPPQPELTTLDDIRSILVAGGYFEAVTFGFVSDPLAADFVPPEAHRQAPLARASATVRKENASLRPSLIPGLLEAARRNESAGTPQPRLFETGSTFYSDPAGKLVERRTVACIGGDVRTLRGVVELLLEKLDPDRAVRVIPGARSGLSSSAAGVVQWGDQSIGFLGLVDKAVCDKLSLRDCPAAAELELEPLLREARRIRQLRPLDRFPAVRRDVSLVVRDSVRFQTLRALIDASAVQWLAEVHYVTTYRGKPLEKGTKSVTVTLVFRSPAETLTSQQVDASVNLIVEAAGKQLGATLRA